MIDALNKQYKDPATHGYVEASILTSSLYETASGIYNHLDVTYNPLATVAVHPAERYLQSSGLYNAIKKYTERGIKDRYNLSLIEYLELPREIHRMLAARGLEMIKEAKAASDAAENAARQDAVKLTPSIQR